MPAAPRNADGWTYYTRYVRCSPRCHGCVDGPGHGPYWYRARRVGRVLKTEYLGKKRPEGIALRESY